jgi:hypothetical protein
MLFKHYLVLYNKNRRIAKLADLAVLQYPLIKGLTACFAVVLQITVSKTNKFSSA